VDDEAGCGWRCYGGSVNGWDEMRWVLGCGSGDAGCN